MIYLLIIIAGAVLYVWYKKSTYNDSEWVANRIIGRNDEQKAVIRYFCNEPDCLSKKPIDDSEYDSMVQSVLNKFNFRQKALEKIGIDEDQLQEIEPVHFEGYQFDKTTLSKQGEDNKWRSSK